MRNQTHCRHTVDNGNGIVWACARQGHPTEPDAHFMLRDEVAAARAKRERSRA
jgi:hypothetical protein